jgi:hypothetical protein
MRTLLLKENFFLVMHTRNTLGTQSDAMHQRFVHRATHSFIRSLIRPPSLVQFTYVHACTSRTAFTSIICLLAHSFILKHSVRQSSSKSGKHTPIHVCTHSNIGPRLRTASFHLLESEQAAHEVGDFVDRGRRPLQSAIYIGTHCEAE